MKYLNKILTIISLFLVLILMALLNNQTNVKTTYKASISLIPTPIEAVIQKGFQDGDVAMLFPYFDELITICVDEEEEIYLAYNAKAALQSFFDNHPPSKFDISHSGKSRGGKETYFIGDYTTENKEQLRIYIFLEANLIQDIEIGSKKLPS